MNSFSFTDKPPSDIGKRLVCVLVRSGMRPTDADGGSRRTGPWAGGSHRRPAMPARIRRADLRRIAGNAFAVSGAHAAWRDE
ncbi:hypothetical protein C0Z20_06455 [Trinickia symbiotica]|uniref:Uncharacterized protein n=1 Tax=Trinickia symbiotica TaxID=863227 RepID=A0A2N7X7P4_9BURK|nr:hypothetical protein C0Z20_06455 [Trinickia symbiotica]